MPAHHGTEVDSLDRVTRRMAAVHRDAAAHHIKLRFGDMQRCRAVARVEDGVESVSAADFNIAAESIRLQERKRRVRQLGHRKVREEPVQHEVRAALEQQNRLGKRGLARKADAVHARVRLDVDAADHAELCRV